MSTRKRAPSTAPRRRWPLRSYLVGLLVLFVVAAGAGICSGWVQARRDAITMAREDASVAAALAAHRIGEQLSVVRGTVDAVASNPGARQVFTHPASCRLTFSLGGADDGHIDVLRADGTVACSSRPPTGAPQADGYAGASWLPDAVRTPHQGLIVALGLFAGLLGTLVVQRRITAPIGNLRAAVRSATTSGDLDPTVTVTGPREIAELGEEFTTLLATVDRELQERRRAEDAALERERNYRQMFDTSPNPVVLFEPDTLDIVAVNAAAAAYYGRPGDGVPTPPARGDHVCRPRGAARQHRAVGRLT